MNELISNFVFLTNNEVKLKAVDKSGFVRFRSNIDFSRLDPSHDFT